MTEKTFVWRTNYTTLPGTRLANSTTLCTVGVTWDANCCHNQMRRISSFSTVEDATSGLEHTTGGCRTKEIIYYKHVDSSTLFSWEANVKQIEFRCKLLFTYCQYDSEWKFGHCIKYFDLSIHYNYSRYIFRNHIIYRSKRLKLGEFKVNS